MAKSEVRIFLKEAIKVSQSKDVDIAAATQEVKEPCFVILRSNRPRVITRLELPEDALDGDADAATGVNSRLGWQSLACPVSEVRGHPA
eukprot:CAMPEP_0172716706 /NCGR_PEP_ID=MMETSP1074-20121228/69245_1 /TAXON_ID=2916 /ORGANISM="Ceratium fusus, Strain PA161109" /LENGTH=88 /DNA_ID=CAMNT_0013541471 /DNA_START=39 /DNA_END=302 /DNA_ORIENTATION=+